MTLRIAHISDIHFGGENVEAVAATREWLVAQSPDLTLITGDLTQFGEPAEFAAAAAWLEQLPGPRLVTPGNHDAPYLAWGQRLFTPFARFRDAIGQVDGQVFRGPGIAVSGVNTARGAQARMNWSKGQIARRQVKGAIADLAGVAPETLRIVACHHPLTELTGGPMTARVWGGTRAAQEFAEEGVDLVLSGHIHVPFVLAYPFGDGRTLAVGAGTLSLRERGAPPGFNLIEADRAAIRIAALTWTGSKFEPARTWSHDRRLNP